MSKQSIALMLVVGLTGGIATGKSTVSSLLSANNIPIIDADLLARQVVQKGTPALKSIASTFGGDILLPDGNLDRKKLGTIIFNDEENKKKLNRIVHPAVSRAMVWQIMGYWWKGHKYCILDVPLLIEGGLWKWVALVVVVYCPDDIQLERLMRRDNSTKEDALFRLNSQIPISQKVNYADIIIDNSGTPDQLKAHVQSLIHTLDKTAGWSWRLSWIPPIALVSAAWILFHKRFITAT